MNILYELGEYGPLILILLSFYLLWDKHNLFFYYTVGLLVNSILNLILKGLIQEPRPEFNKKNISLARLHANDSFYQKGIPFDIYGMPSGHAQASLFSAVFIYLSLKHRNLLYFYLIFSLIICYERVATNYHTILQVIIGSITGALFGYFTYTLAKEKMKGRIREKPDDNGPV